MMDFRRQSGTAIVIALLVVGIVALLASSILWRQEMWIADLGIRRDLTAVRALARSGTDWARAILAEDARRSSFDHLGEPWALKVPPTPVNDGEISGFLDDQQGKWNLNNLMRDMKPDPRQFEILQRLLEGLGLPTALAFALQDWLDADDDPASGVGAEDRYYLTLPVPYRSANALLSHLDELRLVRGFSPQIIEKLRPYVTALPEYAPINVNTAPRPVLAAVLQGVTDAELDTLMSRRERLPFRDLADVRGAIQGPDKLLEENSLTTASRYFLANISARRGDSSMDLACLIRRQAGRTEIVWQRFE